MFEFIKKHLFCKYFHKRELCFPTVWDAEGAKTMGIPYQPNAWHCMKCHPCSEGLDKLLKDL